MITMTWDEFAGETPDEQRAALHRMMFLVFRSWTLDEMAARMDEGY